MEKTRVWLIEKDRPAWQKGKLNGIGGHIKLGETPLQAMCREFREETGVGIPWWQYTIKLFSDDWCVYVFRSFVPDKLFLSIKQTTDELPHVVPVTELVHYGLIPNLRWMIPLQLDSGLVVPLSIKDTTLPGDG